MKKIFITLFAIMVLFSLTAVACAQDVSVNRAEVIQSYDEVMVNFALENNVDYDLGRTRIMMMSYEMPFVVKKRASEFNEGDVLSKTLIEPVYNVEPGFYTIRLSASNEDHNFRRVVFREIYVDAYGNVY